MNRLRKTSALAVAAVASVWLGGGALTAQSTPAASAGTPTFTKDVAPILYKNCAGCHRPGEMGPMSLLTYEQARPWMHEWPLI